MKKIIVFVLCAAIAFSFAACSSNEVKEGTDVIGGSNMQIPNPFVDCETIDEAEQLAGFEISVNEDLLDGFSIKAARVMDNKMIELVYCNGEDEIRIRKAIGKEDISGDYNEYNETKKVLIGDIEVVTKGNAGKVSVAVWSNDEYTYSLTANCNGEGLDSSAAGDIIESIR